MSKREQPEAALAPTAATGKTSPAEAEIRAFRSWDDYDRCVELQEDIWGKGFIRVVPPAVLKICQTVGGVAAGAFEPDGRLVGFVYGVTGILDGRAVHWSHMCAVRRSARDRGLGRSLKRFQRDSLLAIGVETVFWTFDPLEARNAHLNLNRLAATVDRYEPDFYPESVTGRRGAGIGTDRFVVRWDLKSERVEQALSDNRSSGSDRSNAGAATFTERWQAAPRLDPRGGSEARLEDRVRIEIPAAIQDVKAADLDAGRAWRLRVRRAFNTVLDRGYRVEGFLKDPADGSCDYLCSKSAE